MSVMWEGVSDVRGLHLVRWELVKAPRSREGLGVLDLRSMNSALFSKWSWRFEVERNAWWREFIVTKCKMGVSDRMVRWERMSAGWSIRR